MTAETGESPSSFSSHGSGAGGDGQTQGLPQTPQQLVLVAGACRAILASVPAATRRGMAAPSLDAESGEHGAHFHSTRRAGQPSLAPMLRCVCRLLLLTLNLQCKHHHLWAPALAHLASAHGFLPRQ